jgi:4-hydroxyphenylpyruvate dioxygenase-like putative hemolysin
MQFILFIVALAVVCGIIGISAWAFARSFVYVAQQMHRGIVFVVNRACVPAVHFFTEVAPATVSSFATKVQTATRPVEAVIMQPTSAFESSETEQAEPSPLQEPQRAGSEEYWAVFDIPTYLRKGQTLVW